MKEEVKKVEESEMAKEIKAKIAKYEEEIKAHNLVGNPAVANAIQKEVNNLKAELARY